MLSFERFPTIDTSGKPTNVSVLSITSQTAFIHKLGLESLDAALGLQYLG